MTYTVTWLPEAERRLAQLWTYAREGERDLVLVEYSLETRRVGRKGNLEDRSGGSQASWVEADGGLRCAEADKHPVKAVHYAHPRLDSCRCGHLS
jgi:hypothetical protein